MVFIKKPEGRRTLGDIGVDGMYENGKSINIMEGFRLD